ncbi:hypothetical protein SCA03_30080 [Streptomyces cacaoi]|uniref:N-acetylmuramoyl-L-alanine amidase n=2 Tax=Streptomyces cacaoi TaxID=1898 RepID=A0A4Y3R0K9_STRCI|nr:hypothetical protein SCA03_30080 [Streptomyces cacaoi]
MPGATWRPISVNYTKNGQSSVKGVVIHIMAGTLSGTDSWFRNPAARVSAHFGTGKAGQLYQWVDTKDRAWHAASANSTWLGIENEGKGGDKLTGKQLDRCAEVLAWAHRTYGVPLQVTHSPGGRGLGYHAMGGASWGGHTACPGSPIVAQLGQIVSRAKKLVGEEGGTDVPTSYTVKKGDTLSGIGEKFGVDWRSIASLNGLKAPYVIRVGQTLKLKDEPTFEPFPGADFFKRQPRSPIVTAMGRRLVAVGCSAYAQGPGPQWTAADRESFRKWQHKLGDAPQFCDGWPGRKQWDALQVPAV